MKQEDGISSSLPLEKILSASVESFQVLLNEIEVALARFEPKEVSLYSRVDETKNILVISTNEKISRKILYTNKYDDKDKEAAVINLNIPGDEYNLFLLIRTNDNLRVSTFFRKLIRSKITEAISFKKQKIRRNVIEQSIKSNDINSFLHKVSRSITNEILFCDEFTIVTSAQDSRLFRIAGTTCKYNVEKEQLVFKRDHLSPTYDVYQNNKYRYSKDRVQSEELDENLELPKKINRIWWPISLKHESFNNLGADRIKPIGVIRITNLKRRLADGGLEICELSDYHKLILNFVSEVIYVLVQQYTQYLSSQTNYERITHNIRDSVISASAYVEDAIGYLFKPEENANTEIYSVGTGNEKLVPLFSIGHDSSADAIIETVSYTLQDALRYLSDLKFQFERTIIPIINKEIFSIHSDVLIPLLKSASSTAQSYNRFIKFNNFKDDGSINSERIHGSPHALLSVFRNLLDNSAKYTHNTTINIKIIIKNDYKKRKVYIYYQDDGIGIKEKELEDIFIESYRSTEARSASKKGLGIGLSYCRTVIEEMEGKISCEPSVKGSLFVIELNMSKFGE